MKKYFPYINEEGIETATFTDNKSEGWIDPFLFHSALKHKAIDLGAEFIKGDILENDDLKNVFNGKFEAVFHFAALKAAGESMLEPGKYATSNITGTINILNKLNGKDHQLISSVCISKNGSMIWNFTDAASLTMKKLNLDEIKLYLDKIKDKELYAYGVYQIEADGRSLFSKIEGDEDTIMGLPVKQIKEYLAEIK